MVFWTLWRERVRNGSKDDDLDREEIRNGEKMQESNQDARLVSFQVW